MNSISTRFKIIHQILYLACLLAMHISCVSEQESQPPLTDRLDNNTEWGIYRGDKKANQYAELGQINGANVHRLKLLWEYHTGDATNNSSMQCNPIIVDGVMYISTFSLNAIALDAATGQELWVFKSSVYNQDQADLKGRNRGVTYWENAGKKRIFHFVRNRVYALNAETGELDQEFGNSGFIDLREHLDMDPAKADIEVTTPGIVFKNFLIITSRVTEGYSSTPGHIRAFDAETGAFQWIFHTIPKVGEFGYDTWEWMPGAIYGGANAWGGLTLDEERGWVFCATGSPAPDFYGGYRKGMNLFGNCVLALDATTGKRKWHFQTVHHDLWDYDNPSAPILVTLRQGSESQDAVVQLTKMGLTFVLDRDTGTPLFPVEEIAVPKSTIKGEETWPTQPMPIKPPPLSRLQTSESDLTNLFPESHADALKQFRTYQSGYLYTPPSEQGQITTPGHLGGVEWHGGSFDPTTNILYVNSHDGPTINKLKRLYKLDNEADLTPLEWGMVIYQKECMSCHGPDRRGAPPVYPGLTDVTKTKQEITTLIRNGKGIMPSFSQFNSAELDALAEFVISNEVPADFVGQADSSIQYTLTGYSVMKDAYGAPAIAPPWGMLNAIDLIKGDIRWKVPLGEYPELVTRGIRNTGSMNFGGCVATAGGIIFIAATYDEKFRAFEKVTGKLLWETQLPAGGYATPAVYSIANRQYVTIVAGGGGKNGTKSGDAIITFALPDTTEDEMVSSSTEQESDRWINLFNGVNLDGWVQLNGSHIYTVEDSAIVGRTVEGSENSFLCSLDEFDDFEMEVEVMIGDVTNSGIQFRSRVRPVTVGEGNQFAAGRVYGPQAEIRRNLGEVSPTTGVLYGEALGTGWLSSKEKVDNGHHYFMDHGWNLLRIVAEGPRMQTWVNGHAVEDLTNTEVYKTHPSGFIGLQIHGINGEGPFVMKWRKIKIRPLAKVM